MGSVLKNIRSPVWLTTALVVCMILLFSLLIYHAREKEMGEQFNIQQAALAKNLASRVEDLFAAVERSIKTQSAFKDLSSRRTMQLVYEDLGGRIDFLAAEHASGIWNVYPDEGKYSLSLDELKGVVEKSKSARDTVVQGLVASTSEGKKFLVVIAVPQFERREGTVIVAVLSISSLIERNIGPLSQSFGSNAWVIDSAGQLLYHTRQELIGTTLGMLSEQQGGDLKGSILGPNETKGEIFITNERGQTVRTIAAHSPVRIAGGNIWLGIGTHYSSALLHMKETVFIVLLESFVLIIAVVIGSAVMIFSGRRRVLLEEEIKHLREREQWQEDLALEKRKIEGIIEGSPIASFIIDRNHKIIFWNKACTELLGLRGEDMIGTDNQWMPFYPEKRPVIADIIVDQDLDEGLSRFYGEKEVQPHAIIEGAFEASDYYENLGGMSRHLYFLAAPIYDENGEIIAAIETLQDVTREKEMELDLKNYADTLKDELNKNITLKRTIEGIIEGSPIPTFVIDKDHRIILWNKACTELTGYEGKEMIGTSRQYEPFYKEKRSVIADVIVDNDMEGLKKFYGKRQMQPSAVVKGAYEAMDFYEDLGGKRRHLYFLAAPIYDEKGSIIAAVETLQDVTREKEMELNLKEYAETLRNELDENIKLRKEIEQINNYLQTILESSPDRIFDLDTSGVIQFASKEIAPGAQDSRHLKGRNIAEFLDEEQKNQILERWKAVTSGDYAPFEVTATARDGTKRDLLISARPIKNTERFILVQRDITEFKNLEQKFYQSQKLAAVGQLSAGIAHEVRNPLSSIKMSLHILEKRLNPTGNDQKRFKIAQKEVEHLEKLVSDILIFARPADPDRKPVRINPFLEQSLSMAEKHIIEKNVRIETRFADDLPEVEIDQAMMSQVLLNLYLNAIDAMEPGGSLALGTSMSRESGHMVSVTIEDNGCGISPEDLAHIFNPFFTKKKYGTGLGLTQVKKIIDQHKGTIEVKSQVGKGTTVIVGLPVSEKGEAGEISKGRQSV